ncbi:hypothetical protein CR513_28051, partial [Mucuna pruriens]
MGLLDHPLTPSSYKSKLVAISTNENINHVRKLSRVCTCGDKTHEKHITNPIHLGSFLYLLYNKGKKL